MKTKIEDALRDMIADNIDSALFAITHNLSHVFGGLLFSLKLEAEKENGVGDLDNLIRIVVSTSKYDGPEGEQYPVYDEKAVAPILKRWAKILQQKGITQEYNFYSGI